MIRGFASGDVPALVAILEATAVFRPDEVDVGREVLEAAVHKGEASGYFGAVLEVDGAPAGFTCYGPTPCTLGTFDLYWIAVAPACQGRGLAARLLADAEAGVRAREGRQLIAETSDTEPYAAARSFYERGGYAAVARIPDFYRPGDAKVIFVKSLPTVPS